MSFNVTLGIAGITHSEDGTPNKVRESARRVSVGFAPNELPWNKENYPVASGYFRITELICKEVRLPGKKETETSQEYALDKKSQVFLERQNAAMGDKNNGLKPRKFPIMCLHNHPEEFIETNMALWKSNSLHCTSKGMGQPYRMVTYDDKGEIDYQSYGQVDKDNEPMKLCDTDICMNRQKVGGKPAPCKPSIELTIFPKINGIDTSILEPWKFGSTSINTVIKLLNSFNKIKALMQMSYNAEANKELTPDELSGKNWFFGKTLCLIHKQIMSGGNKVWITEVIPSKALKNELMGPVLKAIHYANLESAKRLLTIQKEIEESASKPVTLDDAGSSLIENHAQDETMDFEEVDEITIEKGNEVISKNIGKDKLAEDM